MITSRTTPRSVIENASAALAAENRQIEAALSAEERSLTERRAKLTPEQFRAEADAFDEKVVGIRNAQDAKSRSIGQQRDGERQKFFAAAFPFIGQVLRQRGAVAILDSRAVFLSADAIDVTDELIARLDDGLGAGPAATDAPPPADAPQSGGSPTAPDAAGTDN